MRPIPGPGTGPSRFLGQETLEKARQHIQYPAPGHGDARACCHQAKSVAKNLSAVPEPAVTTSSIQSVGQGFHALGWDAWVKRTVRFYGLG